MRAPHVLIVDDDRDIREMLRELFEHDGFVITLAADGLAALECLEKGQPDLILLDIWMPLLDGFKTCERIRALPGGDDIPILMMTAIDDAASVGQAFVVGADDLLFKPLHTILLQARVRNMIQARQDALARRVSEARFRGAFEHASIGMALITLDSTIIQVNSAFCAMFGYTEAELVGQRVGQNGVLLTHPDDLHIGEALAYQAIEGKIEHYQLEKRYFRKDGTVVYCRINRALVRDAQDTPQYVVSQIQDITERKQAEEALARSNQQLTRMLESTTDAFFALDQEWRFTYLNHRAETLLQRSQADLLGKNVWDEFPEAVDDAFYSEYHDAVAQQVPVTFEEWYEPLSAWLEVHAYPTPDSLAVYFRDVTERKRAEEQLAHDAFHDPLTGLANRALFLDRLGQALERARRGHGRCAVLFLDLDRFKMVNDSLGHEVGDLLLVQAARRLEGCIRPGDTVARLGGDEFAILLDDIAAPHVSTDVAERIAAAFEPSFRFHEQEIVTSASVGIALSAPERLRSDELLRDADIAMYSAKRRGPGHHAVANLTMHADIMERMQLEADLRYAVERGEFVLYYQPAMAINGHRMLGVEALIRWQHPVRGLVSPLDFIPLAEETGLIVRIGEWVLRTACAQVRDWLAAGAAPLTVAVNLSVRQFKQPNLAATIRDILAETGLAPKHLCLELTESLLMEDAEATIATLHGLRGVGIGALAIDDFGTGYSSLSYLQRFPVTELKIDRSFVRDITISPNNATIATAIIALAHSLGLTAVAEGIETEEQRVFLEHAGCDCFQGYLASRPLPADELIALLQTMPVHPEG